jgi:hypothetical protein
MSTKLAPQEQMLNLIIGYWVSRLIYVAAKLKIADLLKGGPRTADELAAAAGVRAPALYRVLRALASVGVFAETKNSRFKLTPLASTLRSNASASMRAFALMILSKHVWDSWEPLLDGVEADQTGLPLHSAGGFHRHRLPFQHLPPDARS